MCHNIQNIPTSLIKIGKMCFDAHQKINKIKTHNDLNYFAKFVEQLFSKPHLVASESAIITFFVTSPKFLIKNVLLYRKRSKIVH
jgi:hypothetical protein